MKSQMLKPIAISFVLSVIFLFMASVSLDLAISDNPETKIEVNGKSLKLNLTHWQNGSFNAEFYETDKNDEKETWSIQDTITELELSGTSATWTLEGSHSNLVTVLVSGKLDKTKSPTRLKSEIKGSTLKLSPPDDENAVRSLRVTIQVPLNNLKSVLVNTISGDVRVQGVQFASADIKLTSGNLSFEDVEAKDIKIESISSDISFNKIKFDTLVGKSVSGDFEVEDVTLKSLDWTTVSGDTEFEFKTNPEVTFDLTSLSGDIRNSLQTSKTSLGVVKIKSTSGDITLKLLD